MISKKKIIITCVIILVIELFRGEFYMLSVKQAMVNVIHYIEENHTLDENIIYSLESDKNIILKYELIDENTYNIKLIKKHVILFFITHNVTLEQKYIVSRL